LERDIDILKDDDLSAIFEPGVPSPSERLKTLAVFKSEGIACGMFLLPVIPFITDTPELIEASVRKASEVGIDFITFGGMTLKEGKQKDCFFDLLRTQYPETITEYQRICAGDKWGQASGEYYNSINLTFNRIAKKYKMPTRIPPALYSDIVSENDLVIVILEHIEYLLKQEGKKSPYGFAAYSISQLKEPLSTMKGELRKIKGVGRTTEVIIREILETGSSGYYEKMLRGGNE
jgi:hypothetical protein